MLLNAARVHAATTQTALSKRPAELNFDVLPEHGLPELTGAHLYLRVGGMLGHMLACLLHREQTQCYETCGPWSLKPKTLEYLCSVVAAADL